MTMVSVSDRYSSGTALAISGAPARTTANGSTTSQPRRRTMRISSATVNVPPGTTKAPESEDRQAHHHARADALPLEQPRDARPQGERPPGVVQVPEVFDVRRGRARERDTQPAFGVVGLVRRRRLADRGLAGRVAARQRDVDPAAHETLDRGREALSGNRLAQPRHVIDALPVGAPQPPRPCELEAPRQIGGERNVAAAAGAPPPGQLGAPPPRG